MERQPGEAFELFFLSLNSAMMSVGLKPSPDGTGLESGVPQEQFHTRRVGGAALPAAFKQVYNVAPDGQSFAMVVMPENATIVPISVILNWSVDSGQ